MDNQILLAATLETQRMAELDAQAALDAAYRSKYGEKMNDAEFVCQLLYAEKKSALVRLIRSNALDPDANEMPGQEQLFPRPAWIVDNDDQGEEIFIRGEVANVEQVYRHTLRASRHQTAKAKKANQNLAKVQAMASYVADAGLDATEMNYFEAVDAYAAPVIDAMKAAAREIEA